MPTQKKEILPRKLPPIGRFALSAIPVKGESYSGFIHRLFQRNDLPSFTNVSDLIGTYPGAQRLDPAILQRLSTASGFAPSVLEKHLGPAPIVGHAQVHWCMWFGPLTSRVCPQCLDEAPIHRQIWQHRFVTVCPVHECMIISHCPDCSSPLSWNRPRLTECRNGHSLRKRQVGGPSEDLLAATRHFYELVGFGRPWRKPAINDEIASLSNDDFAFFVRRLALLVDKLDVFRGMGNAETQAQKIVPKYGSDAALRRAMESVTRWPTALHELLEPFAAPGKTFVRQPKLLAWIRRYYLGDLSREAPIPYRVIKSALIDFAARFGDTLSLRWHMESDGLATIEEVARRTGLTRAIIAETVSKLGWETFVHVVAKRNHVHIKLSDVENWLRTEDIISVTQAGRLLGLDRFSVLKILAMGLLGPDARTPERKSPAMLKRSDVETLLLCLRRQRKGPAKITRYPATTCPAIPRESGKTGRRSTLQLIKAVAGGRLRYWGEPDAPLQWHFHEKDFEDLFRKPMVLISEARPPRTSRAIAKTKRLPRTVMKKAM